MDQAPRAIAEAGTIPPPSADLASLMFAEAVRRQAAGQTGEPEALYRAILSLHGSHAQASYNLGLIFHAQRRFDDALIAYRHAIAVQPDYVEAYCNLGVVLQDSGQFAAAVDVYDAAIARQADFAMAVCNRGVSLKALGRPEEAVAAYRRAIEIKPDYDWAYANLAAVLLEQGEAEAAVDACRRAIAINPLQHTARFNLGAAYKAECRLPEAAAAFREAIAARPDFVEAHFTLGQVLLLAGELPTGWAEYDWRWRLPDYTWLRNLHGDFAQPIWGGESLQGRTILVYSEQGLGDAIHFVRYVRPLARMAAQVVLMVHPPLCQLFACIEGVTVIALDEPKLPEFDVHCPLLSLPRAFGTVLDSIPADVPYLQAAPAQVARWSARLPAGRPRVGVVWAGNPTQTGDRLRSPRLEAVRALFDVPGIQFVALQVGPGRADMLRSPLPAHVLDLGTEIADFTDTAAIMAGLDLVISSCTAPLHLAGALGVPVWGMIPFSPHFPWLLDRSDSPWYLTMRLYRQDRPGADWSALMTRIAGDLATLAQQRAA